MLIKFYIGFEFGEGIGSMMKLFDSLLHLALLITLKNDILSIF